MKKVLSIMLAAMLLPLTMGAQALNAPKLQSVLQHNVAPKAFKGNMLKAPARIDLEANQMIMGHYDTDDLASESDGLGITGLPGVISIATVLESGELAMFQGGKIVKFRVGLAASTPVTRVFVAPVDAEGNIGDEVEWTCNVSAAGWNEVELATPYEINLDAGAGLMIGFDYKQTSNNYPISAVEVGTIYPSYILYQNSWADVGLSDYGNLSLQCIVEKENFPEFSLFASGLVAQNYAQANDEIAFAFNAKNAGTGTIAVGEAVFNVAIDGVSVGTITNTTELTTNIVTIESTASTDGLALGSHVLSITPISLNGEAIANATTLEYTFKVYSQSFPRQKHLIEELTSNTCTYCPLGAGMLKTLMSLRDDIAMVAIHGNQSGVDPSNTAQCDTLFDYMGAGGWPYGSFDRSVGWEDNVNIAVGIGYYEEYHQQVAEELGSFLDYLSEQTPTFATININSNFDAETREATVTIDGNVTPDFAEMLGEDAKLTVYLTEDSLIYRQLNQGTWVPRYQHDHVFRQALGSVFGSALNITGETYKNEYTVTIPEDWNTDKMEIVALISRPLMNGATGVYTDMYVNNAETAKFGVSAAGMLGDVNGDGSIDINDVTDLINTLLTEDMDGIVFANADMNGDGELNINDLTDLINYMLTH